MNKKRFTPYAFTPFGVDIQYLGNQELLKLQKTAFLASNTIPIEMVLVQSNDVWMVDDFFIVENLDSFCFYL